jgi:hypothetical protein
MDSIRFDAWTRRRFGMAAGSTLGALLGLISRRDTAAKHHHHKKKCIKLGHPCTPGRSPKCCTKRRNLLCDLTVHNSTVHTVCCLAQHESCLGHEDLCCEGLDCRSDTHVCDLQKSDRALKANFGSVDPTDMLARVRDLPISTWNSTSDNASVRHIGPMAQDFTALFGVGADDRHIHPLDGQGVALAAIQALAAQIETLRTEQATLASRLAAAAVAQGKSLE